MNLERNATRERVPEFGEDRWRCKASNEDKQGRAGRQVRRAERQRTPGGARSKRTRKSAQQTRKEEERCKQPPESTDRDER
eukprot:3835063-Amphidinium_carterae.3